MEGKIVSVKELDIGSVELVIKMEYQNYHSLPTGLPRDEWKKNEALNKEIDVHNLGMYDLKLGTVQIQQEKDVKCR